MAEIQVQQSCESLVWGSLFRGCFRSRRQIAEGRYTMEEVDPKDVKAFQDLQRRLIEVTEKQKYVSYTCIRENLALQKLAVT